MRTAKLFFLSIFFFVVPAKADTTPATHLLGAKIGFQQLSAFGSSYEAKAISGTSFDVEYSNVTSSFWRTNFRMGGLLSGDFMVLAGGINYHFYPLRWSVNHPTDNVTISAFSFWSPYVGLELAASRVQISLKRNNSNNSDVVLGSQIGPILKLGFFKPINQKWLWQTELSNAYMFSSEVATSAMGLSLGIVYNF